jgi:serine/threonine protein kinase
MYDNKTPHIFSHRYEILQPLGEGGIGKVYRAYDRWIKKDVALKVLAADAENPSLLQSFKREYLLLAQLNHPGVVEVLDFGYSDNPTSPGKLLPYFTMEFVEGKILKQVFPRLFDPQPAPEEFERLYRLIWQICDVLEFLHLRGMVHCDLKPDNLKITGKPSRPKILDFGLSEKIGSRRGKETKGTLSYMAP